VIPTGTVKNFRTMLKAAKAGHLALMECTNIDDNEVYVVCMLNRHDDGDVEMVPVAQMFNENPYEILKPPMET